MTSLRLIFVGNEGIELAFTVHLKGLFQELWQRKIPWGDELPADLQTLWLQWCAELPKLSTFLISRNVLECLDDTECELELHTFSDANTTVYGSVVSGSVVSVVGSGYLRIIHNDQVTVHLITAKSRVAPLKKISLPRLEL
ncbi:hypothetical protein AVEN_94862-1 [Araneus ventricosus]|uniref:Uncharacterized protein n=1 Tax=Araneus ventricosus TaxID=182803 RepID=A0A4Y2M2K6_ARAVE|nr:hypothetical protein AVEN_94862-1 [Araneus ventricosus]